MHACDVSTSVATLQAFFFWFSEYLSLVNARCVHIHVSFAYVFVYFAVGRSPHKPISDLRLCVCVCM